MKQSYKLSSRTLLWHLMPSFIAMIWLGTKASWFWRHQSDMEFGWLVALLCGFIFWETWKNIPEQKFKLSWFSSLTGCLSFVLMFVFQIYQVAFGLKPAALIGLALAVMLMVVANLHFIFGWIGVRRFVFPYAFILIALPMPSVVQSFVVNGLQHQVAYMTVEMLALFGIPADLQGSVIQLSSGPVGVDDACSGIRSLQSTIMATLFIGFLTLRGLGLKCILLVSGVVFAIVGNMARVFFLSYQAHIHGPSAIDTSHDSAGWSILVFTMAGVAGFSWMLTKLQHHVDQDVPPMRDARPGPLNG